MKGYVYFAVEKMSIAAVRKQDGDQFSTASVKLVLMLLISD